MLNPPPDLHSRKEGRMLTYFPEIYPGELLYSLLGRLKCHSAILSPKLLLDDAFGNRNVRAGAFLQSNLGWLAANIPQSFDLPAQRLAMETTLLPYLTAYQPEEIRNWALLSLCEENRKSIAVHARLGLVAGSVRLPSVLRYCVACRTEMLQERGELYWRRDHQLPGVLVCPRHGSPLFDSDVSLALQGQHEFHSADERNCPANPPVPGWTGQPEAVRLLREIAERSAALLANPPSACSLLTWGREIQSALRTRGLGRGSMTIDQGALREAYLAHYDPILNILPDAVPDDWLEAIARKHRKAFAPLRHVLIWLLIDSLPIARDKNPFGAGPWPCRNPLADHCGRPVIADCKPHKESGEIIGVFRCSCGYAFSTSLEQWHHPKILDLSPLFETRLRELVDGGASQRRIAKELKVNSNTVVRYASRFGLKTLWKRRSLRSKLPAIAREEMRAAWINGHKSALNLSRQRLRRKCPAVYAWLYRNDREWLALQPPAPVKHIPNKPRLNWPSIDSEMAHTIRKKATQLRAIDPPEQITRLALESALGQRGWLEKRQYKLPHCAVALNEMTETLEDFQCRRVIWAAEDLQKGGLPIQVWRLRRIAGLRDQCAPIVENLLVEISSEDQYLPRTLLASDRPLAVRSSKTVEDSGC